MNEGNKTITVNRRLRPLRLAFLINPNDKKILRRVFQINTCIWGGRYNPIIPVYRRAPNTWSDKYTGPPSADVILNGYIDAFEPDFIINANVTLKKALQFLEDRQLTLKDILNPNEENPIGYGLDVVELFADLYHKEFQFQKRHPLEAVLPKSRESSFALLGAACFGEFPRDHELKYFETGYKDAFDAKEVRIGSKNLLQLYLGSMCSPLRLGSSGIKVHDRGWSEPALFYMDGTSSLDLIDYWNLRAMGWRVVPLPKQWSLDLMEDCSKFIESNHLPYRHNKEMMQRTTMICSRSSSFEEIQKYARTLKSIPQHSLSCQHWYPRIWDEWARDKDHVIRASITSEETSVDVQAVNNRISFPDLSPQFAERFGGRNTPRWANVIQLSDYSHAPDFASVIPPGTPDLDKTLETSERNGVWSTGEGIVIPSQHIEWTHRWRLPTSAQIFAAYMEAKGFQFKISSAGNIAFQIVRSLNGPWGVSSISGEEIIKLLNKMAQGSTVNVNEWVGLLKKHSRNNAEVATRRLNYLLAHKVLQLGLQLQCPHCSQRTWFSLENVRESLNCEKCLQSYEFPAATPPKDNNWHYRSIGPFSVKNYAQGSYCVAIVLRFFAQCLHSEITWMPSFNLKGKGAELESDFGFFWQQSRHKRTNPTLVLGECKTYDRFEKKDIDRARKMADAFPGSVLAFCTLRKHLENSEKKTIAALARKGRRRWKAEKWHNPVLVLTGTELMSDFGPPHCWKDLGGEFATFADTYHGYNGIQELCEATQRLHLGMESY